MRNGTFGRTVGRGLAALALVAAPGLAAAQALSLEDFAAQVEARSNVLTGYQGFLNDPDPNRAMAALQVMLESGDPTLTQMALSTGIYSADANVRQTALKAFLAGRPSLDLIFDGSAVTAETLEDYNRLMRGYLGSVGAENRASVSFKVGPWSEEKGCYVNQNQPEVCLARVNATTVSVAMVSADNNTPDQWMVLELGEAGALEGSFTGRYRSTDIGPLLVTMRLAE